MQCEAFDDGVGSDKFELVVALNFVGDVCDVVNVVLLNTVNER